MNHLTHDEQRSLGEALRRLEGAEPDFGLGKVYQDEVFVQLCCDIFNRTEPGVRAIWQPVRDLADQVTSRLLDEDPHHAERTLGNALLFLPNVALYTYIRHPGTGGWLIAWSSERVVVLVGPTSERSSRLVWVGSLPEYLLTWRVD